MENKISQKLTKKDARLKIGQALISLTDLEQTLGKKKFKRRLAKAERILVEGLPKGKEKAKEIVKDVE